jgi:hypothetical protein
MVGRGAGAGGAAVAVVGMDKGDFEDERLNEVISPQKRLKLKLIIQ